MSGMLLMAILAGVQEQVFVVDRTHCAQIMFERYVEYCPGGSKEKEAGPSMCVHTMPDKQC